MKKLIAFSVLVVLAMAGTSCDIGPVTFGQVEIIPTVTEEINVPLPAEGDTSQVQISMGGGDLFVNVGDVDGLVKGTVTYNVEEIKPSVQITGNRIIIRQGDIEGEKIPLGNWTDVENRWDLTLGTAPMVLTVNAGAAEVKLTNLAESRASRIDLNGGAGSFTLDFGGDLKQDMAVSVDAGAADVTIIVPEGTAAELTLQGALTDVETHGAWEHTGNKYVLEGAGPQIMFTVRLGAADLVLRNR